jgi:PPOX class probable F420-dependent enzyme
MTSPTTPTTLTTLTDAERAFLRDSHRAVLATRKRDGGLQTAPVTTALDDDDRILISTVSRSAKAHNLARDPHAVLTVVNDGWYGRYAHVEGTAEIVPMPDALDLLVDYYRRARGEEHPDWDEYRAAMVEQGRVVLRIALDRVLLAN